MQANLTVQLTLEALLDVKRINYLALALSAMAHAHAYGAFGQDHPNGNWMANTRSHCDYNQRLIQ